MICVDDVDTAEMIMFCFHDCVSLSGSKQSIKACNEQACPELS